MPRDQIETPEIGRSPLRHPVPTHRALVVDDLCYPRYEAGQEILLVRATGPLKIGRDYRFTDAPAVNDGDRCAHVIGRFDGEIEGSWLIWQWQGPTHVRQLSKNQWHPTFQIVGVRNLFDDDVIPDPAEEELRRRVLAMKSLH